MKRILFIHHANGWGGATVSLLELIKGLDPSEYKVEVLLLKKSNVADQLTKIGIPYTIAESLFYKYLYRYNSHSITGCTKWFQVFKICRLSFSWFLSRFIFASNALKKYNVDLIHLNSSVLTDWLAPCKSKAKVVIHIREPFSNGYFGIRSYFFRSQIRKYADCIVAISRDNAERIGLPDKTKVIYNYTSLAKSPPKEDSYLSKKVLYVGGAIEIKGFHLITDSLCLLGKDVKVLFLGFYPKSGDLKTYKQRIKRLLFSTSVLYAKAIEKMRFSPNAIEIGMVSDIKPYLENACCLVSPFVSPHFSRPIIEAYSNYKTVIATNIQGTSEIVENEKTGILIDPNPIDLANAINCLVNNPEDCKKMGEEGFKRASIMYSSKNIEEFVQLYSKLISI